MSELEEWQDNHELPSQKGKTALVTGANTGLGYETALRLAQLGADVYLGARTDAKAQDAVSRIQATHPELASQVHAHVVNLETIKQAQKSGIEFTKTVKSLDILINNAAAMPGRFQLTDDEIEIQVGVNFLATAAFTQEVMPSLIRATRKENADVKIVNLMNGLISYAPVTSFMPMTLYDLNTSVGCMNTFRPRLRRHGLSKILLKIYSAELSNQLQTNKIPIRVLSADPGGVATAGAINAIGESSRFLSICQKYMARDAKQASEIPTLLATSKRQADNEDNRSLQKRYFLNSLQMTAIRGNCWNIANQMIARKGYSQKEIAQLRMMTDKS